MNIIVDQGNTNIKLAIFDKNRLIFKANSEAEFLIKKNKYNIKNIDNGIFCNSAVHKSASITDHIPANWLSFTYKTPLPINNAYCTPKTLGLDRVAAIVASRSISQDAEILVIDAGTAITYDFIDNYNNYLGGSISPGISLRLRALNQFTGKLPLIKPEKIDFLTGNTTKSSILTGVMNGVVAEINGIISQYVAKYPKIKIFFTGGDTKYVVGKINFIIFAEKYLVLKGLNNILNYNLEKQNN